MHRRPLAHRARAVLLPLLATIVAAATASAQASHSPRPYVATFSTSGQSMWGPGTAPLQDFNTTLRLVDLKWAVGDTVGDIRSLDTPLGELGFGGEIGAYSTGDFGLFSRFSDVSTGAVAVNYPIRVVLTLPDPNTFRDGETITIPSSYELLGGSAITVSPPKGAMDIRGSAALTAGAHAKVCIFGCTQFPLFPSVDLGATDIPLLQMGYDASTGEAFGQIFGAPRVTLPHTITFIESQLTNLSGVVGLPSVHPSTSVQLDRSLTAFGRDTFFNVGLDMDGFVTGKIPLGFETPDFHGAHLKYETVDISTVVKMYQDQTFSFLPTIYTTLTLPQSVAWSEVDGGGNLVASGASAVITFQVGNTLRLTYPTGLKDAMTVSPTFSIRNTFSSDVLNHFREDIVLTVAQFQLSVPSVEIFPSFTVDVCEGLTVDADPLDVIPDEHCPVTTPAVNSPSISIDVGPLYQNSLFGLSQQLRLFPFAGADCTPGSVGCGRWELLGFNSVPGSSFDLDPENPIIAVATSVASGLATGTGPAGSLTQMIRVTNAGDVPLSSAQIADVLAKLVISGGAFQVLSVTSPELTENNAFNGVIDPNTLTRADVLNVGASGQVVVSIGTQPGNLFTSALDADGTSPIGTNVRAAASASFGVFAFNILPSSSNTTANGVLPVVILGSSGMDPGTIDPNSIRFEGVAPLRWALEARGAVNDLTVKFDRQAVLAGLQQRLAAGPTLLASTRPGVEIQPPLDAGVLARALLGAGTLGAVEAKVADRNGNGIIDIGDLRAVVQTPVISAADVLAAPLAAPGGGPPGTTLVLVLTGRMRNGTPFMGENALIIKGNGQ